MQTRHNVVLLLSILLCAELALCSLKKLEDNSVKTLKRTKSSPQLDNKLKKVDKPLRRTKSSPAILISRLTNLKAKVFKTEKNAVRVHMTGKVVTKRSKFKTKSNLFLQLASQTSLHAQSSSSLVVRRKRRFLETLIFIGLSTAFVLSSRLKERKPKFFVSNKYVPLDSNSKYEEWPKDAVLIEQKDAKIKFSKEANRLEVRTENPEKLKEIVTEMQETKTKALEKIDKGLLRATWEAFKEEWAKKDVHDKAEDVSLKWAKKLDSVKYQDDGNDPFYGISLEDMLSSLRLLSQVNDNIREKVTKLDEVFEAKVLSKMTKLERAYYEADDPLFGASFTEIYDEVQKRTEKGKQFADFLGRVESVAQEGLDSLEFGLSALNTVADTISKLDDKLKKANVKELKVEYLYLGVVEPDHFTEKEFEELNGSESSSVTIDTQLTTDNDNEEKSKNLLDTVKEKTNEFVQNVKEDFKEIEKKVHDGPDVDDKFFDHFER